MSEKIPQQETCCSGCPYARATPKSYLDTKGQNGERFVGQAFGPFILPCHMTKDFDQWREKFTGDLNEANPQCAGAAKYRANCGYNHLPDAIGTLPPDHENVFSSPEELLAHHMGIPIPVAIAYLKDRPVHKMLVHEMLRAGVIHRAVEREGKE